MALAIRVSKSEISKTLALTRHINELCEAVKEADEEHVYIPMSGKLLDLVKLLFQHNIEYTLQPAQDHSARK